MPFLVIYTNVEAAVNIGIAAAIAVIMMILAALLAWLLYTKVLWKRFEAQFKKEFLSAEIKDNPLYQSNARETFNPLYQGQDTTGTDVPENSTVMRETYIENSRKTQAGSRASQMNMSGGQARASQASINNRNRSASRVTQAASRDRSPSRSSQASGRERSTSSSTQNKILSRPNLEGF